MVSLIEKRTDVLNAMELGFSSVVCSVQKCNVSPATGRFCKAHRPKMMEDEHLLPPVCRVLKVMAGNEWLVSSAVEYIAKVGPKTVEQARAIYRRKHGR